MKTASISQASSEGELKSESTQKSPLFPRKSSLKTILGMLPFTLQRLVFGALVLLFIIFLTYVGLGMAGGVDFGDALEEAVPKTIEYINNLLHGDLGMTTAGSNTLNPVPVSDVIKERLPRSLGLLGISLILASIIGIVLGILAARSRSQRSIFIIIATLIGVSIPSFFAAFLLQWGVTTVTREVGRTILPVGGFGWDAHIILPVIVLAARPIAQITRISHTSISDVIQKDYVRTGKSKGLNQNQLMARHIFRNSAIAILTTIGLSLRFALSSLPVVEFYFGWPGIGFTLLKGIAQRDANLTIALVLCLGIIFILVNLILELSYRVIDPRLRKSPSNVAGEERRNIFENIKDAWADLSDQIRHNSLIARFRNKRAASEITKLSLKEFKQEDLESTSIEMLPSPGTQPTWKIALKNVPLMVGGILVLGLIIIVFFGPRITPNNPFATQGLVTIDGELTPPPFAPDETYPWGTDALGRGMMSLILSGAQQTLILVVLAVGARVIVGIILGAIAGWSNGSRVDRFIVGSAEVIASFPTLLLVMILIIGFGIRRGMMPFILALCFVGWGEIMQFVRGEVTSLRPRPFIESATAVGARTPRILSRHVMPNLFSPLIGIIALEMGAVLMILGELGFIGIFIGGGQTIHLPTGVLHYSDVPEWGALLSDIRFQARSYPWTGLAPMMAFFVAILSFNLFGEGIRHMVEQGKFVINRIVNWYTVALVAIAVVAFNWLSSNSGANVYYKQLANEFSGERAYQYVEDLTDPVMEGRALDTEGMNLAANYIAREFENLGLQAAGEDGTYFQERKRSFEKLKGIPELHLFDGGRSPVYQDDFAVYPGRVMSLGEGLGPIRFLGLGEQLPTTPGVWRYTYPELEYADFSEDVLLFFSDRENRRVDYYDMQGMLVVVDDPSDLEKRFTYSGRTRAWYESDDEFLAWENPSLWISEDIAERLLSGSVYSVEDIRDEIEELPPEKVWQMELSSQVGLRVDGSLVEKLPVQNVIGYIPGVHSYDLCYTCLARKLIVVVVQYDSPVIGPDGEAYQAAINNASGVAVMLEAIRTIMESDYQPYKTFLFVAYSGEGLDNGEPISDPPDIRKFLQARTGSTQYEIEAIVQIRGVGGGTGDRLEISAGGSLRLAELLDETARQMSVRKIRKDEDIDISIIYEDGGSFYEAGQEAPVVQIFWEGWEDYSGMPSDTLEVVSEENLDKAGRAIAMALMILGRETEY
ncbi:MAG: ABC transporter permease subunit [Anaerolineales bacterium]|nr:ABC transporter permease subunit [Anaerolineales bacterium]